MKTKTPKRSKSRTILSADQTRKENKAAFVEMLIQAGWTRKDAAVEYEQQIDSE